jgi:hypothetical protein
MVQLMSRDHLDHISPLKQSLKVPLPEIQGSPENQGSMIWLQLGSQCLPVKAIEI